MKNTIEAKDLRAEQAKDIAYTINHALACTVTDFIDPYVGNLTQKWLGTKFSIGCGDPNCHSPAHGSQSHLGKWWIGEIVGDFGAVPIAVGLQKYAPDMMRTLQGTLEPLLGGYFRSGAERSTRAWAARYHIAHDSKAYKEHKSMIYHHEVSHLPQALIWTASSISLNLATQKILKNPAPLWQLATGKATGAAISAGLVVGARGLVPGAAEQWDQFTADKIFLPATGWVGRFFGIDDKAVETLRNEQTWLRRAKSYDEQETQRSL